LDELYQHRNTALAHIQQAQYLARVHDSVAQGVDPLIAMALGEPTVNAAVERVLQNYETQYSLKLDHAEQLALEAYRFAQSTLLSQVPELRNTVGPNFHGLHQMVAGIRSQNPKRAAWIDYYFAQIMKAYDHLHRLHAQNPQRQHQQKQKWMALHDQAFTERNPQMKNKAYAKQMAEETVAALTSLGCTLDEIKAMWATPEAHNAVIQEMMMFGALYLKAKGGVKGRRANRSPQVMLPGSGSQADDLRNPAPKLPSSFEGREGLRAAADIVAARRRGR
jgi:hypothetical protein